jgi:hypothetical protein
LSQHITLLVVSIAALLAAFYFVRLQQRRIRELRRILAAHERRDAVRTARCAAVGHDLDDACECRRCQTSNHEYVDIETRRTELRSEAVNPHADPGALHLDSNFQPDADYGLTQTVYLVTQTQRCARCHDERVVTSEDAVIDEPL